MLIVPSGISVVVPLRLKFSLLMNLKLLTIANSCLINIAEHEDFSANKCESVTIVGISIFISRENFMLC